jgi:molybdopterin converting factor small subunit
MKVTVRYMAQVKRATGVASEQIELPDACLMRELLARLAERHGEPLRQLLGPALLVFVGDEQANPGETVMLKDGDEVTLLAPMAGG